MLEVRTVSAALDKQVTISLPKGTFLVLFEFLSRSLRIVEELGESTARRRHIRPA